MARIELNGLIDPLEGDFLLEKENEKPDAREYTIKIIPHQGGTVHSIRLPIRLLKYGAASFAVAAMLFVGAAGYAAYSTYAASSDEQRITELKEVNSIQQEQLLQLSKKANALQERMDQIDQAEMELRSLAGSSSTSGQDDGQGGPYPFVEADPDAVDAALSRLDEVLSAKEESLAGIREQIMNQQKTVLAGSSGAQSTTIPSMWPATGSISSPFGMRWGGSDFHPGVDIANDYGTPIHATADGTVTVAGWNSGGYGNMVDINHGNGISTRYGHMQQVVVTAGQHVRKGQIIGYMGSTGFSTGPHVHYEVNVNGQRVNPVNYL